MRFLRSNISRRTFMMRARTTKIPRIHMGRRWKLFARAMYLRILINGTMLMLPGSMVKVMVEPVCMLMTNWCVLFLRRILHIYLISMLWRVWLWSKVSQGQLIVVLSSSIQITYLSSDKYKTKTDNSNRARRKRIKSLRRRALQYWQIA
jgi:hypothetical protein